jgi:HAD superfamily hydrolase (TIGR01509 family)
VEKIKCVLFDMDGVLIEAKEWHQIALNEALANHGYEITNREHKEIYDGLPTRKKLKLLSENKGLPIRLYDKIFKEKQRRTIKLIQENLKPNKWHIDLMKYLKSENYKIGLCTNSIKSTTYKMLKKAKLFTYFDVILTNEDVRNPKPDPEIYVTAMSKLKVQPYECLILEDNYYGILAANLSKASVMEVGNIEEVNIFNVKRILDVQ